MPSKNIKVAIIGGGVAGLALALTLARNPGCAVELYEAAHSFTDVGAGIGFWPRGWDVLKGIGVFDDLVKKVTAFSGDLQPTPIWRFILEVNNRTIPFYDMESPGGILMLHRADLQAVLLDHIARAANCHTHTGKRLVSYTQPADNTAAITLRFQDGSAASCDVLLGADGLRSVVRRQMCTEMGIAGGEPVWSGTVVYRALVDAQPVRDAYPDHPCLTRPIHYNGLNGFVAAYVINDGRTINVVAAVSQHELEGTMLDGPAVREASREEVLEQFRGFSPELRVMLENIGSARRWAVELVPPLPTYVTGRVALLGDAAHAMSPWQGMGAGQGIEDAYLLGILLTSPAVSTSALPNILRIYDTIRRPFSQEAARRANHNAKLYTLSDAAFRDIASLVENNDPRLMSRLLDLSETLVDKWKWAWTTTLQGDLDMAARQMAKL